MMRKPRPSQQNKKKKKKKRNPHLEENSNVFERIAPLEKIDYPRQLEIKQSIVLEQSLKYQRKTRGMFKSDPLLIRQSWLKRDFDVRTRVSDIVFKCDDLEVGARLRGLLRLRKEEFVKSGLASGDLLKEVRPKEKVQKEGNEEDAQRGEETVDKEKSGIALEEVVEEEKKEEVKPWSEPLVGYDFKEARGVKRNKTEFTVGEASETKKLRIGYFISRNEEKQEWKIDRSEDAGNNSILSHKVADLVEAIFNYEKESQTSEFNKEKLRAYNYYTRTGCFRYLIIRCQKRS